MNNTRPAYSTTNRSHRRKQETPERVHARRLAESVTCRVCETGLDLAHKLCTRCHCVRHPDAQRPDLCMKCAEGFRRTANNGRVAQHYQPEEK
jgi:hypothetical protein